MAVSLTLTQLCLWTPFKGRVFCVLVVLCKLHIWKGLRWGLIQLLNLTKRKPHTEGAHESPPTPPLYGTTMTPATPATWKTELVHTDVTTLWRDGMSTDAVTRPALEVRSRDGDELFRIQISLRSVSLSELWPPTSLPERSPPPSEERERGI